MHNLHGPDVLYSTRFGHVRRCSDCERVQIAFRDHTLLVDEAELETLVQTIDRAWQEVAEREDQEQWTLQAGTDAGPISISLTQPSLRSLRDLLQGAWSMYVLQARLDAVSSGPDGIAHDVLRDHVPDEHFPQ